ISRVRQTFDVEMPLRSVFEAPTIAEMAERVESALQGESRAADPITPIDRNKTLPLSWAQQRLWFLDQLEPGNPAYNVPFVFCLTGDLNVPALEASLSDILRRHEALRTRFVANGDEPKLAIDDSATLEFMLLDFSGDEQRAREWTERESCRKFNLATGPLF